MNSAFSTQRAPANAGASNLCTITKVALAALAGFAFVFLPIEGAMLCVAAVALLSCCSFDCFKNLPPIFSRSTTMSGRISSPISDPSQCYPQGYGYQPPRERTPVNDQANNLPGPPLGRPLSASRMTPPPPASWTAAPRPVPAPAEYRPMPATTSWRDIVDAKGPVGRGSQIASRAFPTFPSSRGARERWGANS